MTARLANRGSHSPVRVRMRETVLSLGRERVRFNRHGIEFDSPVTFHPWHEVVLSLECPFGGPTVTGSGVVVSCVGTRHAGYRVSVLFMGLTSQVQARLEGLASWR